MTAQLAPGGARIDYVYTLDGRIARVTGFSGFVKEYEWCCCGMESYTDEQGTTLLEHNALSQLTSIAYASGLTVTLTPNHLNWNTKTTLPKTSGTEDTSYSYDLRGRVLSITVPDTSATTITIARESMGRPTTIVYSGSHTVVYAWDAMGRATTITSTGKDAANTYVLTYAYVANADRVSSVTTTAAGATVATQTYTYNARLQITKEKVQDGTPATTWERDYSWTAAGLRTKVDDLFNEWDSVFAHDPAGRLSLIQTTDNSGATKANPFPWWEGDTRVSTSPNGDVVSMVSGSNRITYRYDEEMRLVEAEMASGDPVAVTYDGGGNLVSIVQGATTQKTLTHQGRILQTRNAADAIQDKLFWVDGNLMRVDLNAAARNQAWDARGSNIISYQTDGTMDKTRLWDAWGLEVFSAGAGSAPDVGFQSDFDLGSSGLSTTPQNNAWWAELGRSVEGGWRPRFFVCNDPDAVGDWRPQLNPEGCTVDQWECAVPAICLVILKLEGKEGVEGGEFALESWQCCRPKSEMLWTCHPCVDWNPSAGEQNAFCCECCDKHSFKVPPEAIAICDRIADAERATRCGQCKIWRPGDCACCLPWLGCPSPAADACRETVKEVASLLGSRKRCEEACGGDGNY